MTISMPTIREEGERPWASALTLRDYFAAAALQGRRGDKTGDLSSHEAALACYADADAMLIERDA